MNNTTLKNLLIEYDKKRINAEVTAENKKNDIYEKYPKLLEIDSQLSSLAFSTMKEIAKSGNKNLINQLNINISNLKLEKENLLKSLGMSLEDFNPKYECTKCKDTGYILENGQSKMCNCLKQKIYDIEYNKSNLNSLSTQNFNNFNINYYSNVVNEEKYNSKISPQDNINLIIKICKNFITNFNNPNTKNLLFTGKTGLGKTFLSSCIANELLKNGNTVLYQTSSVLLDTIISYKFNRQNVSKDIYDYLLNVDLLIIDDLGTEGINQLKLVELFNLLNSRLLNNNHCKTIISTNLSLQSLFKSYDERIVSRIVGNYDVCYFFGDDIRFLNK